MGMAPVMLKFPPDLLAQVDAEAARRGTSRSEFVRRGMQRVVDGAAAASGDVVQLTLVVSRDVADRIDAAARRRGMDRAGYVRRAVMAVLALDEP